MSETNTNTNINVEGNLGEVNPAPKDKPKDKPEDKKPEDKKPEKMFSQEEVDKMIEKRLAREKQKAEDERKEAERLAKMSEQERLEEEFKKKQADLEARIKELDKKEMQNTSLDILVEKGYSPSTSKQLLAFLDYADADACKASIDTLDSILKKCIETEVNAKIKGGSVTPKKPNSGATGKITWEQVVENPKLMAEYRKQQQQK